MRARRTALAAVVVGSAMTLAAQFNERIDVIAVEVPIHVHDRAGKVPADLTKGDFEVFEDGVRQEVIGLAYPVAPVAERETPSGQQAGTPALRAQQQRWQIVVLLQESMSSTTGLRGGVKGLLEQADRLAELGDVEIVTDYPAPHVLLPPTNDAEVLRTKLEELRRRASGHQEVQQLRQLFERQKRMTGGRPDGGGMDPRALAYIAVASATAEAALIRRRQDALLGWMARYAGGGSTTPRLLLYVTDGFPLEPVAFYTLAGADLRDQSVSELRSLTSAPRQNEVAQTIAAMGWTVLSISTRGLMGTSSITEKTFAEILATPAFRPEMLDNLAPMRMFNDETGGKLATDIRRLGGDLDTLQQRLTLTYQVRRRRDGALHNLEIRSCRPGLTVETRRAVMTLSAEGIATARATSLALNFGERGELPVTCRVAARNDEESLEVDVDLAPFGAARASMKASTFRIAIGVAPSRKLPFHHVQRFDGVDLSSTAKWGASIPIRKRGDAPSAVVVEELSTGLWGGARCE